MNTNNQFLSEQLKHEAENVESLNEWSARLCAGFLRGFYFSVPTDAASAELNYCMGVGRAQAPFLPDNLVRRFEV